MPEQHVSARTVVQCHGSLTLISRPFDDHPDQGLGATPPHFHVEEDQPKRSENRLDDPLDKGANPIVSSGGSRSNTDGWRNWMSLTRHDRKPRGHSPRAISQPPILNLPNDSDNE